MNRIHIALFVLAACASEVAAAVADADQPVATEVSFVGSGGFELHGTLLTPALGDAESDGLPSVLLLPGSGPTDRDGNQPPAMKPDVLKQIAEALAAEGIASLRFDKRACAVYASEWPKTLDEIREFFAWSCFVEDAKAAFIMLRDHDAMDDKRVAIAGHSEGGLIALCVASDLAEDPHPPAGLMLVATAGRRLDLVLREQIAASVNRPGIPGEQRTAFLEALDRGITEVREHRRVPSDVPPGLRTIFNPAAVDVLHAYFTIDPVDLIARVSGPALVLNGENDSQISAERDAPRLNEALAARTIGESKLVIVGQTSHNLKAAPTIDSPGFTGPVVPEALAAILEWTRRHLDAESGGAPDSPPHNRW
jgi:pimeloyl-ACP methyl ester carboxylesterase